MFSGLRNLNLVPEIVGVRQKTHFDGQPLEVITVACGSPVSGLTYKEFLISALSGNTKSSSSFSQEVKSVLIHLLFFLYDIPANFI
jgi:hypothetical protein